MEHWLPVVGFEGLYEVSDHGRVRSLDRHKPMVGRWGPETRRYKGRVLRLATPRGQLYARVVLSVDGVLTTRTVHSLVAEAFIGPRPKGQECRHLNCDASDNRAVNLAYGPRTENRDDSRRAGTLAVGERIAQHKLTEAEVVAIRAGGRGNYPVSRRQLRRVRNGEAWRHV